jgi:hypothetical protein
LRAVRAGEHRAGDLESDIGSCCAAAEPAEGGVGERHDGVEAPAGDRAEHEDDREQARAVAAEFSSSRSPTSRDSVADHRGEDRIH